MPILIHAGKGLRPIAEEISRLVDSHDDVRVILAHAAIADMNRLVARLAGRPGVFYDTSVWSPADLAACCALVSPRQLLYGSDFPYGQQPASLLLVLRTLRRLGFDEAAERAVLADNALCLAARADLAPPGEPAEVRWVAPSPTAARLVHYLAMLLAFYWADQPSSRAGILELAITTSSCCECDESPQLEEIRRVLEALERLWRVLPALEDRRHIADRQVSSLLHLALALTGTLVGAG